MLDPQEEIFKKHLKILSLKTVQEYRTWCNRNGLSSNLNKNEKQRAREIQIIKDEKVKLELSKSKTRLQPIGKILKEILKNSVNENQINLPVIKEILKLTKEYKDRDGFFNFVSDIEEKSDFIGTEKVVSAFGNQQGNTFLEAILKIYEYKLFWVSTPESWNPTSHNSIKQFLSLVSHLFCKYKVPTFLFSAWLSNDSNEIDSFICLAQGDNFKKAGFKVNFNKKQSYLFLKAPDSYTVPQALRFGQVLGLGGDKRLVEAINSTDIGFDEFWDALVIIFINNPMLDRYQIGPIIDYIKSQKFGIDPPHSNFCLKGRTAESLLRQTEVWHSRLIKERPKNYLEWKSTGILPFEKIEGTEGFKSYKVWKIVELLNSKELTKEGSDQKHCVSSYSRSASVGRVSIWSLRQTNLNNSENTVTIEINPINKSIVQARMKYNKMPDEKLLQLITEWASKEGLSVNLRHF